MSSLVAQLVKNLTDNSGNTREAALIPELGTFPGEGNGNPFQYACLETSWTEEPGGLSPWGHKVILYPYLLHLINLWRGYNHPLD